MDDSNNTLAYYNEHAEEFVFLTKSADMVLLYDMFQKYLKSGGKILDIGCGSGRDSKYFMEQGYDVVAVDGSEKICELASQYIGKNVLCIKFQNISFANEFDGIWACASLLHIPKNEMAVVLKKLSNALKTNGYIYASFKYGQVERINGERFFNDYTEKDIDELFNHESRLNVVEWSITEDVREGRSDEKWLNVVAVKIT
ncbi:class I SAM-dependent methyltransferase [Sinanaerobacter sp. ZZT-01]|uniref:class I SAM-dependent methyltransferase n=1 Tax=Sinanaerobacter sp. ZZT-01 TaxID=3111540 RepID=UPI002D7676F6|nr:class I SAM-dependent methyltransferase [Sinanaerobacter sp. ZZT-01]WRR93355.1 class I SAM-dependent methyltransferase [Sinanaerobacter sp. ZZT-01]